PRVLDLPPHHGPRSLPFLHRRHAQQVDHLRGGGSHEYSSCRKDAPVQWPISRFRRRTLAAARHRPGTAEDQEPDRTIERRSGGRNHRRNEPNSRRRSDGRLSLEADQTAGSERYTDRDGNSGWLGSRIRRRSDHDESDGRPPRPLIFSSVGFSLRQRNSYSSLDAWHQRPIVLSL